MRPSRLPVRGLFLLAFGAAAVQAQVTISGRVVDETGAPVPGTRVEMRNPESGFAASSSDAAGNFNLSLGRNGDWTIRAERLGFYVFEGKQRFEPGAQQLLITLNHLQEFSERIDVVASPPAIDPQQASDRRELDGAEIQAVPFPAPQDYRNALPLLNGVLQDNAGVVHVNGAAPEQTSYTLDGFDVSDPLTGRLEARVNIETIQSMGLETSRFAAENGRGSAGALDLKTKTGDDRWRAGATNFIPSASTDGGLHINKWTPRLQLSGPIARGRAWFHNGFDAFYSMDVVHGLPAGQNQTRGLTLSDLTRFQVNLAPSNILTGSFLLNMADNARYGLTIVNPAEATNSHRQSLFMTTIRDQQYIGGALVEAGFADTRTVLRNAPQGDALFEITPAGNRGNYFIDMRRHSYRQQWLANLFLPTVHFAGEHQWKFGIDVERESFDQKALHRPYEVLREDNSVARRVSFPSSPFQAGANFEAAQYIQDHWTPYEGIGFDLGLRAEWNEILRDVNVAPRLAAVLAPRRLKETKFSVGWGVYYEAVNLNLLGQQGQESVAAFYLPDGSVRGPFTTAFRVDQRRLQAAYYRVASLGLERKLPFGFYSRAEYLRRTGDRGFSFEPAGNYWSPGGTYELRNTRRDRYDAFDFSLRRTFAGEYEWFAGYVASRSRTNAAVTYGIDNPIFGPQMPGPFPWDATHRFHMWGWLPLPNERLPEALRFLTRNTTVAYLVEYRTGFPFSVQDEEGFLVGAPGSRRLPGYFNINLHLERKFRALHYLWAWRFGYNNLANSRNPNAVNNVIGTPKFLTYGRGQDRAFSVRLRLLGRK